MAKKERRSTDPETETLPSISETDHSIEPANLSDKKPRKVSEWWQKWSSRYLSHKRYFVPLTVLLLLIIFFTVPLTRYKALGLFIRKDANILVLDTKTNSPVSSAKVEMAGRSAETDGRGVARFKNIPLGSYSAKISKKYYKDTQSKITVGLSGESKTSATIEAIGRQVNITVTNAIGGKALEGVLVKAGDTEAKTDKDGLAMLIVAPGSTKLKAELSLDGYNATAADIEASDRDVKNNKLALTPAGKIFFLSKLSGKIDVVKANLDGSAREVVLAGTGNEDDGDTVLLASRDWKYLALKAKRDTKKDYQAIYLIDTATGKLSTIDEGNASFTLYGWAGQSLVFVVDRLEVKYNQTNKYRLKSFDAKAQKLRILDQTIANNYGPGFANGYYYQDRYDSQDITFVSVTDSKVVYIKNANYIGVEGNVVNGLYVINPDGSQKKAVLENAAKVKSIDGYSAYTYKPGEIYYLMYENQKNTAYEYEFGGSPKSIEIAAYDRGQSNYATFVVSPDGSEAFWSEPRDGKSFAFLGSTKLENGKQLASLSEHNAYGWYGKDYLLMSKKDSELYIMTRDGGELLKVTDYHKPDYSYRGYGYGYGGL